jgi:hypothetical protein
MGEPNLGGAGTFECDGLCVVVYHCLSLSCIEVLYRVASQALIQKRLSWADFTEKRIAYEHLPSVTNLYLTGY